MADVPQTLAEIAKVTPHVLSAAAINTLIADDPFLAMVPMEEWEGGESFSWVLNKTAPTVSAITPTTVLYSTQAKRYTCTTYPSELGGEVEHSISNKASLSRAVAGYSADVEDLIRAFAIKLRGEVITGDWMTEANATLTPAKPTTPGIDTLVNVTANMPAGAAWIKYTHVGTTLALRAPGSSTFGTGVSIAAGDADYTLTDGDDSTKSVTVTVDASDFTGGAENLLYAAIDFQRPEAMAGLKKLAALDSAQTVTASTDGDAVTLAMLDEMEEGVLAPRERKIYLCSGRTRRAIGTLQRAAGGATVMDLKSGTPPSSVMHNGIPVIKCPGISIAETQGASTTCGRIYCVALGMDGFYMKYVRQDGPNFGRLAATSDDDINGALSLPLYVRVLGERENYATFKTRATGAFAGVLAQSKKCFMRYGITS